MADTVGKLTTKTFGCKFLRNEEDVKNLQFRWCNLTFPCFAVYTSKELCVGALTLLKKEANIEVYECDLILNPVHTKNINKEHKQSLHARISESILAKVKRINKKASIKMVVKIKEVVKGHKKEFDVIVIGSSMGSLVASLQSQNVLSKIVVIDVDEKFKLGWKKKKEADVDSNRTFKIQTTDLPLVEENNVLTIHQHEIKKKKAASIEQQDEFSNKLTLTIQKQNKKKEKLLKAESRKKQLEEAQTKSLGLISKTGVYVPKLRVSINQPSGVPLSSKVTVLKKVKCLRILSHKQPPLSAKGVLVKYNDKSKVIKLSQNGVVVCCAGELYTPLLLQNSKLIPKQFYPIYGELEFCYDFSAGKNSANEIRAESVFYNVPLKDQNYAARLQFSENQSKASTVVGNLPLPVASMEIKKLDGKVYAEIKANPLQLDDADCRAILEPAATLLKRLNGAEVPLPTTSLSSIGLAGSCLSFVNENEHENRFLLCDTKNVMVADSSIIRPVPGSTDILVIALGWLAGQRIVEFGRSDPVVPKKGRITLSKIIAEAIELVQSCPVETDFFQAVNEIIKKELRNNEKRSVKLSSIPWKDLLNFLLYFVQLNWSLVENFVIEISRTFSSSNGRCMSDERVLLISITK